jgi:hypothetical protein
VDVAIAAGRFWCERTPAKALCGIIHELAAIPTQIPGETVHGLLVMIPAIDSGQHPQSADVAPNFPRLDFRAFAHVLHIRTGAEAKF